MESLAKAFESIITFWNSLYNWSAQGIEYRNFSSSPQIKPSVEKKNSSQAIYVDIFRCVAALWSEPCDHLHPVWSEHWHPSNFVFNQIQFSINLWLRVWVTCLHELTRFFWVKSMFHFFSSNFDNGTPTQIKTMSHKNENDYGFGLYHVETVTESSSVFRWKIISLLTVLLRRMWTPELQNKPYGYLISSNNPIWIFWISTFLDNSTCICF